MFFKQSITIIFFQSSENVTRTCALHGEWLCSCITSLSMLLRSVLIKYLSYLYVVLILSLLVCSQTLKLRRMLGKSSQASLVRILLMTVQVHKMVSRHECVIEGICVPVLQYFRGSSFLRISLYYTMRHLYLSQLHTIQVHETITMRQPSQADGHCFRRLEFVIPASINFMCYLYQTAHSTGVHWPWILQQFPITI